MKFNQEAAKCAVCAFMSFAVLGASACGGNTATSGKDDPKDPSSADTTDEIVLPDYDSAEVTPFYINSWYAPNPTEEEYERYKAAGFNYIFLMGNNVGELGAPRIEQSLALCDKYGIKAFVDASRQLSSINAVIDSYSAHESFVGFNYDEPVIYKNSINNADGIVDIGSFVENMTKDHPEVGFLVNLNPSTSVGYDWGTPSFTYDEYIEAQLEYVNSVYKDSEVDNWISCDDYPLYYNPDAKKTKYYLKTTWLQNLEYLATAKRDNPELNLKSNFFIQSMAYGTDETRRNRVPEYEDIRLQMYALLAFGYDSVSYFCYAMPPSGGEFQEKQYALLDHENNATAIYDASKRVNEEMRRLEKIYMQFNSRWIGVCPVIGTNNVAADEDYYNKAFDAMNDPIPVNRLSGVSSVVTDEDIIIGLMRDKDGNNGYMIVNYNDAKWERTANVELTFDIASKALVYKDGEKTDATLSDGKLSVTLGVGEGVFVIPYNKK